MTGGEHQQFNWRMAAVSGASDSVIGRAKIKESCQCHPPW